MTYWTMDESDGLPAVTLCSDHALEATNIGCDLFGLGPFEDMAEAAAVLEALTAIFGQGQRVGFEFHSSETGSCDECEAQVRSA